MILAPLRGVTIRCFRETFAKEVAEYGFTEAITPFITANAGVDPLKDREIGASSNSLLVTPQFIGKDPAALRFCLERIKSAGYETADLNCGCPFPMVRNKGRGSGILRTPDVLRRMLDVGCEVMGEGKFSIKARLGVERTDELLELMPLINQYPLRFLTVHTRTAKQMYEGECDWSALSPIIKESKVPLIANGDLWRTSEGELKRVRAKEARYSAEAPEEELSKLAGAMIGRAFIRSLGERDDARELVLRYIESSQKELSGDRPVLGRMKELLSYWAPSSKWSRRWNLIKICRSVDELRAVI